MHRFSEILAAVQRKDLPFLGTLTTAEANLRDGSGLTLLMNAILDAGANPAVVRQLIGRGADVNADDNPQKWTALHFAARDQRAAVVSILLEAGAAVDPEDAFGDTPLWRGVMNSTDDLGAIEALVAHGADPARKNHAGNSPLKIARETGRADIVEILERRSGPKS